MGRQGLGNAGSATALNTLIYDYSGFEPSDAVCADSDSDGKPNVVIGRWPARTLAELNAVLVKTLTYQRTNKALLISDRSLNGVSYASEVAPMATLLSKDWTVNQHSLDSYAAGQVATARADIVNTLSQGISVFSYHGHSAPTSWSREGLTTASKVNGGFKIRQKVAATLLLFVVVGVLCVIL